MPETVWVVMGYNNPVIVCETQEAANTACDVLNRRSDAPHLGYVAIPVKTKL